MALMNDKSDITHIDKPNPQDIRTDAEKFEDAMRAIVAAPKKEVAAQLAEEKEVRKQKRQVVKQT